MSNDPYVAPSAELQTDAAPIKTSIWNAKGRIGRLTYLAQYLALLIVFMALFAVIVGIAAATGNVGDSLETFEPSGILSQILPLIVLPIFLLLFYLSWCLLIKRLHDRDHVGWWSLLALIPLVNTIFAIYVLFFPGQKHANRYGGQRLTKGWEKVLGILFIVLMVAALVGGLAALIFGS